jgi:hypothetical protein
VRKRNSQGDRLSIIPLLIAQPCPVLIAPRQREAEARVFRARPLHLCGGQGEELVAGLLDAIFHSQPVEQRALGLLLAGGDFNPVPSLMGWALLDP